MPGDGTADKQPNSSSPSKLQLNVEAAFSLKPQIAITNKQKTLRPSTQQTELFPRGTERSRRLQSQGFVVYFLNRLDGNPV